MGKLRDKTMKRTLCLICIGTLALTLTAWGQPTKQAKPERATAHRTANVRATRPANNAAMRTAPSRQPTQMAARTQPNRVATQNARTRPSHQRNVSSNREFRARNNAAMNRERNVAVNRARNLEVNRNRNAAEMRARKNL